MQVLINNLVVDFHLQDFNLSQNKSLRELEIRARFIYGSHLLTFALSTITSPAFSKVTIIYWDSDLPSHGVTKGAPCYRPQFELFRAMRRVRNFQLVLCAHVRDDEGDYSVRKLKQIVAEGKISPEPLVVHSPCAPHNRSDIHLPSL
jgi:hypothetical protein